MAWLSRDQLRSAALALAMVAILIAANIAAFSPGLGGAFFFDDIIAIVDNESLRHLHDLPQVLWPERDLPTAGRPLPNLSLAINYQLHQLHPWGYRATNLGIHCLSAVVLMFLVRRLARSPIALPHIRAAATPLALIVALIWSLHPLQAESVLYATQRTELSVGLMLLLTLYALVRARQSESSLTARVWLTLSVLFCLLGMFCKEVMFFAPVLTLLLDRVFFQSSYAQTLRKHWLFYLALLICWIPMVLILASQPRALSVGFNYGISAWQYLNTQAVVILIYLRQIVWPFDLAIVNNIFIIDDRWRTLTCGLFLSLWVFATFVGIYRGSWLGLLGAWFFFILAPSSSIVPIATEIMAERRMYLPLIAVLVAVAVLAIQAAHELSLRLPQFRRGVVALFLLTSAGLALLTGWSTWSRSPTWLSPETLYREALVHYPECEIARNNLALHMLSTGRPREALVLLHPVFRYKTHSSNYFTTLANAANRLGHPERCKALLIHAVNLNPRSVLARSRLAEHLLNERDFEQANHQIEIALTASTTQVDPWIAQARLRTETSDFAGAAESAEKALRIRSQNPDALALLGAAELKLGRADSAQARAELALRVNPAHRQAGVVYATAGEKLLSRDQAQARYEQMLQRQPGFAPLHEAFGQFLLQHQQTDNARKQFQAALTLAPQSASAMLNLAKALLALGRPAQARAQLERAAQLQPEDREIQTLLQSLPAPGPASSSKP